jgi:hypothetical protein
MMMCGMASGKGIALMLISMGVGYMVCAKAEKEQGFLKQLGYWIGAIIIVVSILTALGGIYKKCYYKCMKDGMYMHEMGGKSSCGMMKPMHGAK